MTNCLRKRNLFCFNPPGFLRPSKIRLLFFTVFSLITSALFAQQRVSGKIVSRDFPLAGVTVAVKGTTNSTMTDEKGNYTITAPTNSTLVFTNVGYATQEIKIGNKSTIDVHLEASSQQLTDVVVVGYGVQKKVTVTGAVATVKGTELQKSPAVNLSNSLAGRLPGVIATNGE